MYTVDVYKSMRFLMRSFILLFTARKVLFMVRIYAGIKPRCCFRPHLYSSIDW